MNVCKKIGLVTILAAVFFGLGVNAQETGTETPQEIEEILVLGERLVNRNFVETKRNAVSIVDSVGENEIGGLAAANAAELLTKIPGLNAFEDLSGRGSGGSGGSEVRFVSIRGIRPDLNLTLLDGLTLAVPNFENRAQFLDWFPVNLAKRTDVVKTFTADMNPAAIGGQINFVTRSGLYDKPLFTLIAEAGQTELDASVQSVDDPLRLEALFVGKLADKMGLAISASYNKRDIGRPSQLTRGRSRSIDFPTTNDVRVVREHRILSESAPTERIGLSAKLDYAPNDAIYTWLTAAYNTVDQTIHHAKTDVRIPSSAMGLTLAQNGGGGNLAPCVLMIAA